MTSDSSMGTLVSACWLSSLCLFVLLLSETCVASVQSIAKILPGFQGSQMNWVDHDGLFLLSNNSVFSFGFTTTPEDVTLFELVVMHMDSLQVIWTANRGSPVKNSDKFMFLENGNVMLQTGGSTVWLIDYTGKGVSSMELQDSGNLVLLGDDGKILWQSFSHPTNTLISEQEFVEGMGLVSDLSSNNLSYVLEFKTGDVILSAGFPTPQPYWSMSKDNRNIINKDGVVSSAALKANSWRFYGQNKDLVQQFVFSDNTDANVTWIAVLGNDGFISFYALQRGGSNPPSSTKIPKDQCSTPEPCDPYNACSKTKCQCPAGLSPRGCKTGITSPCERSSKDSTELVKAGDGLGYFALEFVSPSSRTDLSRCKASCIANCSCLALFFQNSSGNCYTFDRIGSFQISDTESSFVSYVKVSSDKNVGETNSGKPFPYVVIIAVSTVIVIAGLLYVAYRYYKKRNKMADFPDESSEEDNFLESLSGMPVRFSYKDLQTATDNFSVKLGQGGFGSVYKGTLPDGTRIAVKKLEGIGQGKKEFRAEVSIIGSIHHHHLVRLRGFCAEGAHRMLAYEYMGKGSLDRWIFRRGKEGMILDWETRFNIALGTAKGLAYLHEDCDVKIIHCDIKPENVLLDDNYLAKVSDFGLAKLMTREQSHVFTTMRGTRGYLAPEWITNYAISEKSDVYSYGMVLLEIIGGRKNFDASESSEKSHFPTYACKMMEEGKLRDLLDSDMNVGDKDDQIFEAVKVALWCIQEDMSVRPSMTRVVQMLEGLCDIPAPPTSSQMGSRLYSGFFKSISEGGTSSGPSDCNSKAYMSAVRLSGPR